MTENELIQEVKKLGPFHHKVELGEGISTYASDLNRRKGEYTRIENFKIHAFASILKEFGGSLDGKSVMDVACNCGGFSFEAVKNGADRVFGFDIVEKYIEQANFIKKVLDSDKVDFKTMNIDELDPKIHGTFDITFCFGILYHLENPVYSMKKIADLTKDVMIVDTNTIPTTLYNRFISRKPIWLMNHPNVSNQDSKNVTSSRWRDGEKVVQFRPNDRSVVNLLNFLGFPNVKKIQPLKFGLEKRYYNGGRSTFIARR